MVSLTKVSRFLSTFVFLSSCLYEFVSYLFLLLAYFPFETLSAATLRPDIYAPMGVAPPKAKGWLSALLGKGLDFIEVPKYAKKQGGLQLKNGLQYGAASGFPEVRDPQSVCSYHCKKLNPRLLIPFSTHVLVS